MCIGSLVRHITFGTRVKHTRRLGWLIYALALDLADTFFNRNLPEGKLNWPDNHRAVNLDLAGGAMLDLGIDSLTWLMQILYHLQPEEVKEPPSVVAAINKHHTGVSGCICRYVVSLVICEICLYI